MNMACLLLEEHVMFYEKNQSMPSNKKWKAAFYIRLSLEDVEVDKSTQNMRIGNKTESESVSSQRLMLTDFAKEHPDLEIVEEYVDDGYSGTTFDRPNIVRLIDDIRLKKVDCVIVKDLSRFGRNYIEVGNYLEVLFPMLGVRFIAIIDHIDSYLDPNSVNNISVPIKNIMNENYCRDLSLKVRSAYEARKRRGLFVGSYAPFGYKKDPNNKNKLLIDDEAAAIIKRIFNDCVNGLPLNTIAKNLNRDDIPCPSQYKKKNGCDKYVKQYGNFTGWNSKTIKRYLEDPIYIGTLVQKKREIISYKVKKFKPVEKDRQIVVENAVEPILDKELFDKVQSLLKRDTKVESGKSELTVLSGYMKCGLCKHGMSKAKRQSWNKKYFINYYVCTTYKNCGPKLCTSHNIKVDYVESCVFEFIKSCVNVAIDFDKIVKYVNEIKNEAVDTTIFEKILKTKTTEQQKKKQFIEGLYPDYRAGIITQAEYTKFKTQASEELSFIEREIENLKSQIDEIKHGSCVENDFIKHFMEFKDVDKLTRKMVVDLIDNVWVYDKNHIEIDIKYKSGYQMALDFINENKQYLIQPELKKVVNG